MPQAPAKLSAAEEFQHIRIDAYNSAELNNFAQQCRIKEDKFSQPGIFNKVFKVIDVALDAVLDQTHGPNQCAYAYQKQAGEKKTIQAMR